MHRFGPGSPLASPAFGMAAAPHGTLASSFGITKLSRDDESMVAGVAPGFGGGSTHHFAAADADAWVDPLLDPAHSLGYGSMSGMLGGFVGNVLADAIGVKPPAAKPSVRFHGDAESAAGAPAAGRAAVSHPIMSPAGGGYLVRGASEHVAAFFGAGSEFLVSPTRPAPRAKPAAHGAGMPMDAFPGAPIMAAGSAHAGGAFGAAGTASASALSASTMHAEASYRSAPVTQTALTRSQAAVDCCITSITRSAVIPGFAPLGKPLTRRDGIIVTATELQSLDLTADSSSARGSSSSSTTTAGPTNAFVISWVPDPSSAHMKAPARVWVVPFTKAVPHDNGVPGAAAAINGFVHDMTWLDDGCTLVLAAVGNQLVSLALPAGHPSAWEAAEMVVSMVQVTQSAGGSTIKLPTAHSADIWSVAASPTLAYAAAGGFDGKISIYSLDRPSPTAVTASLVHIVDVGRAATCMRVHPTRSNILLVALEAGGCDFINMESGAVVTNKSSVPDAAFACAWVDDRSFMVGTGCGRIVKSDSIEFSVMQIDDPVVAEIGEISVLQQPGYSLIACSGAGGVSVWQLQDHATRPAATLIANVPLHRPSTAPVYPPASLPGAVAHDAAGAAMIAELGLQEKVSAYQYPLAAKATAAFMTYGSATTAASSGGIAATFLVITDSFGGLQMFDVAALKMPATPAAAYEWLPVVAPPATSSAPAGGILTPAATHHATTAAAHGSGRSAAASGGAKSSAPGARGSLTATMLNAADIASWQIKDTAGPIFPGSPLPPAATAPAGVAGHRHGRATSGPFSGGSGGGLRQLPLVEDDDALLHSMGMGIDMFQTTAAAGARGVPTVPQMPIASWHGPRGSLGHDDDLMSAEV